MQTFDQSIFSLYQQGLVTLDEALRWASNVDEFKLKVQGISTTAEHGARRDGQAAAASQPGHHPVWRLSSRASSAYLDALHLLSRRELSVAECRDRLRDREHPDDEIDARSHASSRPAASTTRGVAQAYARTAVDVKGRGRLRVVRELQARGIDKEVAAEARRRGLRRARTNGRSSPARCRRSCAAGHGPPTRPSTARLYQYLMRQGFTPGRRRRLAPPAAAAADDDVE